MGGDDNNRYKLTDEEIIDLIITIMYSGYETVSTTSMMALKYLHDHPKVLEEMRVSAKVLMLLLFYFIFIFFKSVLIDNTEYRKSILPLEKGKSQKIQLIVMISSQWGLLVR